MSQQHTTQASGQGMLERVFKLREHGTTARTEVIAGFTTFLTMVYIVFVNPQILGVAGMDTSAVFVTTCLIAALGSILMGVFANLPVALAPAMGLNAFFVYTVCFTFGLSYANALVLVLVDGIVFVLLTVTGLQFANLVTGTVVVENVFVLPGIGRLVFQAISNRDLIVVRDVVMLLAAVVVTVSFVVDVLYALIDPRLRAAGA